MFGITRLDQLTHGVFGGLVGHGHRVVQTPALVLDIQAGAEVRRDRCSGSIGQLLGKGAILNDLFSTQGHGTGLVTMMGHASYPTHRPGVRCGSLD